MLKTEKRTCLGHDFYWIENERGAWDGPSHEFEKLSELCLRYTKNRGTVLSAGACMGLYPGLWVKHARFARAVAIEPEPDNFEMLRMNCVGDEYALHNAALAAECGRTTLYRFSNSNRGMHSTTRVDQGAAIDVASITVDSLRLTGLDVLQLDVEGAEFSALLGADSTIREFGPVISVETLSPETRDFLTAHGYAEVGRATSDTVFARN